MPLDDLERVADALGVSLLDLLSQAKEHERPDPRRDRASGLPQLDSNQQPAEIMAGDWLLDLTGPRPELRPRDHRVALPWAA